MPSQAPADLSSRFKRESFTITRSVGKALADVMNMDKARGNDVENLTGPAGSRTALTAAKRVAAATTREKVKPSRPSLDSFRRNDASGSDVPIKRPPTAPPSSNPAIRRDNSSPVMSDSSPSKLTRKYSKQRASLTLHGLPSALQPKSATHAPSTLLKDKLKPAADSKLPVPHSGMRKRLANWDAEKDEAKNSEEDVDDSFVTVDRPISPLPRRAADEPAKSSSLPSISSTPPSKRSVLHKQSSSVSSSPTRPSKVPNASSSSALPLSHLQNNQATIPRPSSSASLHSQCATPVRGPTRKLGSDTRAGRSSPSRLARRRPTFDSCLSPDSKLDASPRNPYQLPETSGSSLLSPPLSPFLEGVSLDSVDSSDVSALLSTILSPANPPFTPPPAHKSRGSPEGSISTPTRQTIASQDALPSYSDVRESLVIPRQHTGDLEDLLSQPLPSALAPDSRERLLSFGSSLDVVPPPCPPDTKEKAETQMGRPVRDGQMLSSISQVLFPQVVDGGSVPGNPPSRSEDDDEAGVIVESYKSRIASAEAQCAERDARIARLEGQLLSAREARERDAVDLAAQVADLEERLKELLQDRREREQDSDRRAEELWMQLQDRDAEWDRRVAALATRAREQALADQDRLLSAERRKWTVQSAWGCARTMALSELELVHAQKTFVEVTLASLDLSMQQLRDATVI